MSRREINSARFLVALLIFVCQFSLDAADQSTSSHYYLLPHLPDLLRI